MVSVLALSEVDRGFIDGVIVNVLALIEVTHDLPHSRRER
jgi:hypothetical protein